MGLKVGIYWSDTGQPWSHDWKRRLAAGIEAHGDDTVEFVPVNRRAEGFDVTVSWGVHVVRENGFMKDQMNSGGSHLVIERGYVGDRSKAFSLGFDGLNGRARFPAPDDTRFNLERFGVTMKEWVDRDGPVYVMGQVPGDASIRHVVIEDFYEVSATAIRAVLKSEPIFRPHPEAIRRGAHYVPSGMPATSGLEPLSAVLDNASAIVTFNSNTGVDAVMNGVPVFAFDRGSMAYPVASWDFEDGRVFPDRVNWASEMAVKQWTPEELESGEAWARVRTVARRP